MKQESGYRMAERIKIPLLDLKREYKFLKKSIDKELKECFSTQNWVLGQHVARLEKEVAKYLGATAAIGVASGTDALILSLRALAIDLKKKDYFEKKDEIITTPFTFIATAEAIVRSGATPVFMDINPDTFNIDLRQIKKAISKNTVGILPVHLFGLSCDMSEITKVAKENNLFVVEDTAQAFGAEYTPKASSNEFRTTKKLGTMSDCSAFSFFPSKNLGAFGDAGLVATNNNRLAELIKFLRNHGQVKQYDAQYIGYNSRLDSIQAAILLAKLKHIDKFNDLRIKIAQKYNVGLKGIRNIQLPAQCLPNNTSQRRHVYHLYTVKVDNKIRDGFSAFLNSNGIQARVYYPLPLHKMSAFKHGKVKGKLKNAETLATRVISLPINPFLTNKEVDYLLRTVAAFFAKRK
jgi:dTDP-4-amino-4,6-dideoxygalactose transaminase